MDLTKVNHVITEIKSMLNTLETTTTIDGQDAHNLLPILVRNVLQRDPLEV